MNEMKSKTHKEFPLTVTVEDDGSITIDWDPDHPITSVFNSWTEQDFKELIITEAEKVIESFE